jgi:predicted site-specific integrase-resolvase
MGTPEGGHLLASVQVCKQVGIDRSTLSRYVQLGRITPAMRLPGKTGSMLFDPADVEALNDWYHNDRLAGAAS